MSRVFIGIGSNQGDRLAAISRAVQRLARIPQIRVTQMASILETEPVGGPPQDPFLNTVVELDTSLEPAALLHTLKQVERELGREPSGLRWGPRPIDLDILLYDDRRVKTTELTIPHERLHQRRFVLEPLAQLAPALIHPVLGLSVDELLETLTRQHAAV